MRKRERKIEELKIRKRGEERQKRGRVGEENKRRDEGDKKGEE